MPTPPPWWIDTQVAPLAVLSSALSKRPVADRVAAVLHRLGLAIGAGDRAAIEMITPDHDRCLELAAAHHLVKRQAQAVALPQADPADARGQALEMNALARRIQPLVQVRVIGDQLFDLSVGFINVFRIAGQRRPAKRPTPRQNSGRTYAGTNPGKSKAFSTPPTVERDLADVVAVIDRRHAPQPDENRP